MSKKSYNLLQFSLEILEVASDEVNTGIAEAIWIHKLRPKINRREELMMYNF